ncbi:hypothetical protein PS467_00025 [Streptomyces luomodiensis]|uniref:MarR family transcriptional regulator n=1 Tax=Streptomyces luomodiensis TaxID=3026192 RepID=A0ABY9UMR8_9ACTN|nr:hypothetical protein [Streptomyces sp. SCA4-21]WNE93846.1 hypothetical protein PS467_00025 [Streptomyces sp. SCA4-21]
MAGRPLILATRIQRNADKAQAELLSSLDEDERGQLHALLVKALEGHKPEPA